MMKGGLGNLMKQAQQMQENMKAMQEKLASIEVEGQSGAGMVKIIMTCRHDVKRVSIDDSLIGDDKEMLEDLIAAAVNDKEAFERQPCDVAEEGQERHPPRPLIAAVPQPIRPPGAFPGRQRTRIRKPARSCSRAEGPPT